MLFTVAHRSRVLLAGVLFAGVLVASATAQRGDPGFDDPGDNTNPDTVSDTPGAPGSPDQSDLGLLPVAFHKVQHFEWLGKSVDEEAAPVQNDDKVGHVNDDDGFYGLGFQGTNVTVRARLSTQFTAHPFSFPAGALVWVDAWIDWNSDSTFADPGDFVGSIPVSPPFGSFLGPDGAIVNITGPAHGNKAPDYNIRLRLDWHDAGNAHVAHAGGEADGNVNAPGSLGLVSFGEVEDYRGSDPWYIRSLGKGGSNGVPPHLTGGGPGTPGSIALLNLEMAKPNTSTALIIGLNRLDVLFKGGTLLPTPDIITFLNTDATGKIQVLTQMPATMPSGVKLYLQFWPTDTVQFGVAASNGLRLLTQ